MTIRSPRPKARFMRGLAVAACVLSASFLALRAQSSPTPTPPAKTAEQQFKNIQVLKGIPANQVIPTMQFISASLGVECNFCHVDRAFEKDDKKTKQSARFMIEMQNGINKNFFKGEPEVSCNTCHRGSSHPMSIPAVADAGWKPAESKPDATPAALPQQDGSAVFARYMQALGGQASLEKVKSLIEKGTSDINGHTVPVDIYTKAPDSRLTLMHMPNGDSATGFNGRNGWQTFPGRPVHDISSAEIAAARLDATFTFPASIPKEFSKLVVGRPDKIDGRAVTVLMGLSEGKPPVRLFFDDESGLLVRMVCYTETALGRNPTQIDYSDYRTVGEVKIPHQWTISRPANRFAIKVDEVKINAPIEDSKFVRPPDPPQPPQPSNH